jgi:hypothetical protein
MRLQLSPKEQVLYSAVDEVLHYIWDPIGVSDIPQARDEYHLYLPRVFELLNSEGSEEAIAAYLANVVATRLELPANPERDLEVAKVLIEWRAALNKRFA